MYTVGTCLFVFSFTFHGNKVFLLCSVDEILTKNLALDTCLSGGSFLFDSIEKLSFTFWSVDKIEDKKLFLTKKTDK